MGASSWRLAEALMSPRRLVAPGGASQGRDPGGSRGRLYLEPSRCWRKGVGDRASGTSDKRGRGGGWMAGHIAEE